jgi:hypothetical protein
MADPNAGDLIVYTPAVDEQSVLGIDPIVGCQVMSVDDFGSPRKVSLMIPSPSSGLVSYLKGEFFIGQQFQDNVPLEPNPFVSVEVGVGPGRASITVSSALAAAATAQAQVTADAAALLDLTPRAMRRTEQGLWTYDSTLKVFHERFGNNPIRFYDPIKEPFTKLHVILKDVNAAGGQLQCTVSFAPAPSPPGPLSFTQRTVLVSDADGTYQEIIVPMGTPFPDAPSVMELDILPGPTNGGPAIPDQYQVVTYWIEK